MKLLVMEDAQGLVVWPQDRVAALSPAYPDQWRGVCQDGSVAYRPSLPEGGPWVRLGDSWVLPALLRRVADGWVDPGEFLHPVGTLPPSPEPEPLDPRWAWEETEQGVGYWENDRFFPCPGTLQQAVAGQSGLVRVGPRLFVRLARVRRLLVEGSVKLLFDNGQRRGVSEKYLSALGSALGVTDFRHLQPYRPGFFSLELREYPVELATASAAYLKAHFREARILVANLIWQGLFYALQGTDKEYGRDHQGYFYMPVSSPLSRIGFMRLNDPLGKAKAEELFQRILAEMVGDHRLFTFAQLGFEDTGEARREIGSVHPRIVLVVEKKDLTKRARILARRYGISLLVTGGVPKLVEVEFFLRALGGSGPLILLAYVDWDPGGYWVATTMVNHCLRYGVACAAPPQFLVRPEHFSAEELELYSRGLDAEDSRVINWVKATDGIAGQARGVYAEWLRPFARVEAVMDQAMRALGVTPQPSC